MMLIPSGYAFFLPSVAEIRVMADEHHQPSFIIDDPTVVRRLAVGNFPSDPRATILEREMDVRNLRFFLQVKDAVENGMFERKLLRFSIGKHPLDHLAIKMIPVGLAPKVVHHQKTAVEQVSAERIDFVVAQDDGGRSE